MSTGLTADRRVAKWQPQPPDYFDTVMRSPAPSEPQRDQAIKSLCELHLNTVLSKRRQYLFCKRAFDVVAAALGLLVLALPLAAIAAIIVATTHGSPIFGQRRYGRSGRPITVFKFVTMYKRYEDRTGANQTVANDPRVTPFGRFLRRTSIDELPQLWNVVRGDMSLVGPRAHAIPMRAGGVPYAELCPLYSLRHLVRPGIAGLAQSNGYRGPTSDPDTARHRLACDLTYIAKISFTSDLKKLPRMSGF